MYHECARVVDRRERGRLFDTPHMVIFPALAVMTAVLAFNLLGDAWRDWLDPRTRSQLAVAELTR
jgi:peptide/nickel transport system permease protein